MCGILALYSTKNKPVAIELYNIFQYLQHRGQDGTGIVTSDLYKFYTTHTLGDIKNLCDKIKDLPGHLALAHNRYPTAGSSGQLHLLQPWRINSDKNTHYYVAFNGTLVNTKLDERDTLSKMIGKESNPLNGIKRLLKEIKGAYSLILMTKDSLYITRDRYGIRPLIITNKNNHKWIISSETCVLSDNNLLNNVKEVLPGEIIRINNRGLEIINSELNTIPSFCIFEYVYFARPDSILENNQEVYQSRIRLGKQLARECKNNIHIIQSDYVIGVPNSSVPHAIGFSQEIGIMYCPGLIRNTTHRTFILNNQKSRKEQVSRKFSCLPNSLKNKSIIVIDDSIVRGNTMSHLVQFLRNKGANKIHVAIASPPVTYSCYMGIDIAKPDEFIAKNKTIDEIKIEIGCDSLTYLSLEGLKESINPNGNYCTACFTGNYPNQLLDW